MGNLENFGKNWIKWPIFDALVAEDLLKLRVFKDKLPNFVKIEDFIS